MKFMPDRASRFLSRQKLKIDTHSPTILLVAGIGGAVGATVLACRATIKVQPVLEATKLELDRVQYDADQLAGRPVDPDTLRRQRVEVYARTAGQISFLYAPAFVVGVVSVGCLVTGQKILSDRYSNMAAAYVTLQESIEAYRRRVAAEIGDEREKEIYHNGQETTFLEEGPNGPKKKKAMVAGDGGGSPYARFFGPDNQNWKNVPEYNVMFLRQAESYLNVLLRRNGHVFLNDAYRELGMDDTEAGAVCGWLYERDNGDDSIDFGIWDDESRERFYDFMVGNEGEILLDFNVDGPIHTLLNKAKVRK